MIQPNQTQNGEAEPESAPEMSEKEERLLDELIDQKILTDQVVEALCHLVQRIDYEAHRDTPLIPKGEPNGEWSEDYPAELREARSLLSELVPEYQRARYFAGRNNGMASRL
jgi:hypothetical protein